MPTIEDVTRVLEKMDSETYGAAVRFIYYLDEESKKREEKSLECQRDFIRETSGKIIIDEDAVNDLRMGSMI